MPPETPPFQPSIDQPAAGTMGAAQVGAIAASVWRRIEDALWPIIGHAGMAALFKRSLYLARGEHPCLGTMFDAPCVPSDFPLLRETLARQSDADAAATHAGLLRIFLDLLSNLIGASLTERLLRSVWDNPSGDNTLSGGAAVQDTLP
jgi:hypothetical protein